MFNKEVYIRRRKTLMEKMAATAPEGKRGLALFIGNVEAPAQYKDNAYKFRQDSSWIYFFGLQEPRYAAVLDLDSGEEKVYADDVDMDDIVWMGPQPSVAEIAAGFGVSRTASYGALDADLARAAAGGRRIHFLPPSRYYNTMKLASLLGYTYEEVAKVAPGEGKHASMELVKAVISMRLVKEDIEIAEMDKAGAIGQKQHSVARDAIRTGIIEQSIVGLMDGVTLAEGWGVSFPTILTQHGETLHNHLHDKIIEPGRLMVIDAGAENNEGYASDFTRTYPTSGKFTAKQRDVYQIVADCNELAFEMTRPGVTYYSVHKAIEHLMLSRLKDLGIIIGDADEAAELGVAGLFMPHGLGHNIGLDVHDMEDLGEDLVGYDDDQKRSPLLGLGNLRMARKLVPGNFISDEPGIYFIPALIAQWKAAGTDKGHVNYGLLEKEYLDFGGIRLEDDVLVTADGARRTGPCRLPIQPDDVEEAMARATALRR